MHKPADTEERNDYLAIAYQSLVKVESTIAEAEDRERRMASVPVDTTRFSALRETR